VVFLDLPCEAVERRLGNLATRGVTLAPGQTLEQLYDYRRPFYQKWADLTVNADQPHVEDTVELVLSALRQL
jgi:shikimate kinase